jgi:hypothetical protein
MIHGPKEAKKSVDGRKEMDKTWAYVRVSDSVLVYSYEYKLLVITSEMILT